MIAPHPRRATVRTIFALTSNERRCHTDRVAALEAAVTVRAARRNRHKAFDAVNVYETTDRDGAGLIVAYVHYQPGTYDDVSDYFDLYEIPTQALTDL